jgi:hypothetical protein
VAAPLPEAVRPQAPLFFESHDRVHDATRHSPRIAAIATTRCRRFR